MCSAAQYDLSAMRTLDENIVSQLDLSEDATAVAMKRLSMWQEEADTRPGENVSRVTALSSMQSYCRCLNLWLCSRILTRCVDKSFQIELCALASIRNNDVFDAQELGGASV